MQAITEQEQVYRYRELVQAMTESEPGQADQFNTEWLLHQDWKVVPVEDVSHFSPEQRDHMVAALNRAGYQEGVAVATEPLGDMPECYTIEISEMGLEEFNRECGLFRFLLTTKDRYWAISCTESYNLFAGPPELLEAMLGKSIKDAWQAYWDFIGQPSMDPNGLLHQSANRYAALQGRQS
jgi:hypothetical protein